MTWITLKSLLPLYAKYEAMQNPGVGFTDGKITSRGFCGFRDSKLVT